MKRFSLIIPVFFLMALLVSCSHKEYPAGTFQDTPVVADGELGEWSLPLRFGSSTGLVQYNITNDNENIYISLQTHDEATAIRILRAGVNIYIDPEAGHSKKINLAFPLPLSAGFADTKNNNSGKTDRTEMKQSLLIQATAFKATGFQNMEDRMYDVSDKSKIKVAIKSEPDNSLGYEAVVPLKYIYGNSNFTKEKNKNLSVAVQINASTGGRDNTRPGGSGNSNYNGGMRGGGGGRRGGMGSGGYRSGNNNYGPSSANGNTSAKADVNWYSFKLASKNN